ncbi:hypothetical protein [Streptomyces shenzhenensis]|uniref:hypothetical protein n=1 Tax=Streptomyces shenzhenensis TaxID=943815 RepID=UPI003698204F
MSTCTASDGTELARHVFGDGPPLVCLPGGLMQGSACLGELGGLSAGPRLSHRPGDRRLLAGHRTLRPRPLGRGGATPPAAEEEQRNDSVAAVSTADRAFDPDTTRVGLTAFG